MPAAALPRLARSLQVQACNWLLLTSTCLQLSTKKSAGAFVMPRGQRFVDNDVREAAQKVGVLLDGAHVWQRSTPALQLTKRQQLLTLQLLLPCSSALQPGAGAYTVPSSIGVGPAAVRGRGPGAAQAHTACAAARPPCIAGSMHAQRRTGRRITCYTWLTAALPPFPSSAGLAREAQLAHGACSLPFTCRAYKPRWSPSETEQAASLGLGG